MWASQTLTSTLPSGLSSFCSGTPKLQETPRCLYLTGTYVLTTFVFLIATGTNDCVLSGCKQLTFTALLLWSSQLAHWERQGAGKIPSPGCGESMFSCFSSFPRHLPTLLGFLYHQPQQPSVVVSFSDSDPPLFLRPLVMTSGYLPNPGP